MMKREHNGDESVQADDGDGNDADVTEGVVAEGEYIAEDVAERPPTDDEHDAEQGHVHRADQEIRDRQPEDEVVVIRSERSRRKERDNDEEITENGHGHDDANEESDADLLADGK